MEFKISAYIFICLQLVAFSSLSQGRHSIDTEKLLISSDEEIYQLNPAAKIFVTKEMLSGVDAFKKIASKEMRSTKAKVNQGMNDDESTYWLLFELENRLEESNIFLEIDYAQLDYAQLYEVISLDSVVSLFETGDKFPFFQRPIPYRNFVFPISIPPSESTMYLLNLDKRASAIRFPINVHSEKSFSQKKSSENVFYLIYFGFTTLIILLSLIVGIRLKKTVFLWYSVHVFIISLWAFTVLGFSYHYIIPNLPELNTHFLPIITSTFNLCFLFYVRSFFKTKMLLQKFHKVMNAIIGIFFLSFLLWAAFPNIILANGPSLLLFKYGITIIIVIFSYTAAFKYIKIDPFISKIFILAYTFLFIGTFTKILSGYGIVDESNFILDPLILGFTAEVSILSIAMVVILFKVVEDREKLLTTNKQVRTALSREIEKNKNKVIDLKSGAILPIDDIISIKADGHYLEFKLARKSSPEIDRNQIRSILTNLPSNFVQIHRSHVINIDQIKIKQANKVILKDGSELPISRTYKDVLNKAVSIIK